MASKNTNRGDGLKNCLVSGVWCLVSSASQASGFRVSVSGDRTEDRDTVAQARSTTLHGTDPSVRLRCHWDISRSVCLHRHAAYKSRCLVFWNLIPSKVDRWVVMGWDLGMPSFWWGTVRVAHGSSFAPRTHCRDPRIQCVPRRNINQSRR